MLRRIHLVVLALTLVMVAGVLAWAWTTQRQEPPHPQYALWIGTLTLGGLWSLFALISSALWRAARPRALVLLFIYPVSLVLAFVVNFACEDLIYEHWVLSALGPDPSPPGRNPH